MKPELALIVLENHLEGCADPACLVCSVNREASDVLRLVLADAARWRALLGCNLELITGFVDYIIAREKP